MANEQEPNRGEAIRRFFAIPEKIRNELIYRSRSDFAHLKVHGLSLNDVPEGSILPHGNTVILDDKGRKLFRAPDVTKPVSTPADN